VPQAEKRNERNCKDGDRERERKNANAKLQREIIAYESARCRVLDSARSLEKPVPTSSRLSARERNRGNFRREKLCRRLNLIPRDLLRDPPSMRGDHSTSVITRCIHADSISTNSNAYRSSTYRSSRAQTAISHACARESRVRALLLSRRDARMRSRGKIT